jgi:hypothetical protein
MSYNVLRRNRTAWYERAPTICTSMLYKQAFTMMHFDDFINVLQRASEKVYSGQAFDFLRVEEKYCIVSSVSSFTDISHVLEFQTL